MSDTIFQFQRKVFDINIKNKIGLCLGRQKECFCNCSVEEESWYMLVLDGVLLLGPDMLGF